jgi:sulfatase modifying factor 1
MQEHARKPAGLAPAFSWGQSRMTLILPDPFPPPWACEWADDAEWGLSATLSFRGVRQRFRWIAPGRFRMGSPEDEPEPIDNEMQHEVTLSEGYWLADTACTQALWQAVMGKNPSRFKDPCPGSRSSR